MKKSLFAYALVFALTLFASCQKNAIVEKPKAVPSATTGVITPTDIPAGYGYPGDRAEIQAWADQWEIAKITEHTWNMWAGMTADSGQ
ncbi:MAG TPA: hypothetical protein VHQ64_00660, partial [Pyrinomonadaceae bacterium]|nr:hypothetical protein [Pyrinomonadaceae bacterium]